MKYVTKVILYSKSAEIHYSEIMPSRVEAWVERYGDMGRIAISYMFYSHGIYKIEFRPCYEINNPFKEDLTYHDFMEYDSFYAKEYSEDSVTLIEDESDTKNDILISREGGDKI